MQKNKGNGAKLALALLLVGIAIVVGAVWFVAKVLWPIEAINTNVSIELGDNLDRDISLYVVGNDWSVGMGSMDWSQVREDHIGTYVATYTHGREEYTYSITVCDTVPPEVMLVKEALYYLPDQEISLTDMVASTYDLSGDVTLETEITPVRFHDVGPHVVTIVARDSSGNETWVDQEIMVDTAPQISCTQDCYVAIGNEYVPGEGLVAQDEIDGDISDRIRIDSSLVDWDKAGEYNIEYSAMDNYGLLGFAYTRVHVMPLEDLNRLVADRTIDRWNDEILGATNLYCGGSAELDSLEDQEEFMLPCVVHVSELDANEQYGHTGSGYIIDMDEDYIYIGSCQHVLRHADSNSYIYFYDGTRAHFEVIGSEKSVDVGFLKVKVSDLSEATRNSIFSCQLDLTRFNACMLREGEELFFQLVKRQGYEYVREGISKGLTTAFSLIKKPLLWITAKSVAGNSGSGVFDEQGNLVGMVEGYHIEGTKRTYVAIPADIIYEQFVEITGRELFVK